MRLGAKDYSAINEVLVQIYALRDLDGFVTTAMQQLPALVESELSSYNEVNFEARRLVAVIDSTTAQSLYHERQLEFERLMHQNPLIEHSVENRGAPTKISDFLNLKQWRDTGIYREFYGRLGVDHQMALVLTLDTPEIVAFAFNRKCGDFTERHRAIMSELQPHLTRAYRNAVAYTRTTDKLKTREEMLESIGVGWLDLNADLTIDGSARAMQDHLRSFFPVHHLDDAKLPPDLENWVAGHLNTAQSGRPVAPLEVDNVHGRLILRLVMSAKTGAPSLIGERFLNTLSPQPLEGLGLTERQAETLYWLAQGKSNAEIAIILKIGARTVENHVYRIFETLKVNNRTEAANVAVSHLNSRG